MALWVALAAAFLIAAESKARDRDLIGTIVSHESFHGIPSVVVDNGALRVTVLPSRGGKVVSVLDKRDGGERLWQKPDQQDYPKPPTGAKYGDFNSSGIDECLPTIAPCDWRGRKLTDHGEVWTEETKAVLFANGVRTVLKLPISPLRFERELELNGNVMSFYYKLTNTSNEPWEYQWAFHGLVAVEEGDRIVLPPHVKELFAEKSRAVVPPKADEPWARLTWPIGQTGFNYVQLQTGKPGVKSSLKAYTPELNEGWCALHNPRTGKLWALSFDPRDTSYVGIWINNGEWGGYTHVALEPCNGGPDRLDVAVKDWRWFSRLQPGESKKWRLNVVVRNDVKEFRGLTGDGHLK